MMSAGERHPEAKVIVPELVEIPEGWFLMGSVTGQEVERPVHRVWVDAFSLAATQVTVAEYAPFLAATRHESPPQWTDPNFSDLQHPIVAVSWFDAISYCDWLSRMTGLLFRLPTEAEWERAARGGIEGSLFPWGNESIDIARRFLPANHWKDGPERVRQSPPNAYGLFEMCENVHEWCSDWFAPSYYSNSPERNPRGPETGERKSSRGGSWRHHIKISRCSTRSSIPPDFRYADYGFRLACSR